MIKKALLLTAAVFSFINVSHAQPAQLKFAVSAPARSFFVTDTVNPWVKWMQEQAGDEVRIKVFAGGTLGRNPVQQLKLVRDRVADLTLTLPAYTPGRFTDLSVFELPGLVTNADEGSKAVWKMYKRGLLRGFEDLKVVGLYTTDTYNIHTATKIASYKDVKGLKLRIAGAVQTQVAKALGAVPVGMPPTQIAESVNRKLLSGAILNWAALIPFKVNRVTKYHYHAELGVLPLVIVMNKASYAELPAKARSAVDRSGEQIVKLGGGAFAKFRKIFLGKHRADPKRTVIEPSASENREMAAIFKKIHDDWKAKNGDKRYDTLVKILADIRAGR